MVVSIFRNLVDPDQQISAIGEAVPASWDYWLLYSPKESNEPEDEVSRASAFGIVIMGWGIYIIFGYT